MVNFYIVVGSISQGAAAIRPFTGFINGGCYNVLNGHMAFELWFRGQKLLIRGHKVKC